MQYTVIPSRWKTGREVLTAGQTVDHEFLAGIFGDSRVDGFRRLGIIQPAVPDLPTTKTDLLALAEEKGIVVPEGEWRDIKPVLVEMLKEK